MIGVGKIAKDAWDQIFTLGKAPVSEMGNVCLQIEDIQNTNSQLLAPCGCDPKA
jgi:hypothetical protein